ncbi:MULTISPECIES: hypothetical protein [unclassified Knoellia]
MRSLRIAAVAVVLAALSTIGATSAQAGDSSPAKNTSVKAAGWQW